MPTFTARMPAAAVLGGFAFLLIGWTGLLVPTLIRSVEASFGQNDAGLGGYFFVFGLGYGAGVLGGAVATERIGRRPILVGAALLVAIGLAILGTTSSWPVFVIGAVPFALGQGALDGGGNGLILDLFPNARGRALSLLHLAFSCGALACPFVVGSVVAAGAAWPLPLLVTAGLALPLAGGLAIVAMPSGRRRSTRSAGFAVEGHDRRTAADSAGSPRVLRDGVLLGLGAVIATYVASEVGVSDWLVRFLHQASLPTATLALTLYWGGIAVGRLVAARIGDRFDHRIFAMAVALMTGALLVAGVFAPTLELSIAAFALAGVTSGPIFPLVVAVGGDRFPERSAAIGGYMVAAAVVGGLGYPALMGLMSTSVGLPVAMVGTGLLAFASGAILFGLRPARPPRPA